MSRDSHAELRSRIVRKLRSAEWMEQHFGVSAHAEDVADAVMELFHSEVTERWEVRGTSPEWGEDEEWTMRAKSRERALEYAKEASAKGSGQAYRVLELRTVREPITEGGTDV